MTTIQISPQLADKLTRLAAREHTTVDKVLERLLEPENAEEMPSTIAHPRPGSGAALLKFALEADINGDADNLAENSREILNNEFPEYLRQRVEEQNSKD
ncbi:MAG: hypothetical protein LCI00_12110 [Chloroflexi bacterium]|nr:hypothetical protein [Chloroflexota bacterium]MCC6896248.1 hypothetical protein [Anaerolineae bacterium]